jgi:hypothetical protein
VPAAPPVVVAQLLTRERVLIRIPTRPLAITAPNTKWKRRKGPKCIDMNQVRGAALVDEENVDLLLRDGGRVRAEFEDACPALDFYSSFYFRPGADRKVCADRDSLHARSGGECPITRFRKLEAEPAEAPKERPRGFRLNPFRYER